MARKKATTKQENSPVEDAQETYAERSRLDLYAAMTVAQQLGRTKSEMVGLMMQAREGPRDEESFRDWKRKDVELSINFVWSSFTDRPYCAWSVRIDQEIRDTLAEAFEMIRGAAERVRVVHDSKAANELAVIRHAIDGGASEPVRQLIAGLANVDLSAGPAQAGE